MVGFWVGVCRVFKGYYLKLSVLSDFVRRFHELRQGFYAAFKAARGKGSTRVLYRLYSYEGSGLPKRFVRGSRRFWKVPLQLVLETPLNPKPEPSPP